MRVVRLLSLAAVLFLAYFAQYLLDHGTLAHLVPAWMMQRFPLLVRTTLWLPADLYTLALWLLAGSALLFGLLAPQRKPPGDLPVSLPTPPPIFRRWGLFGLLAGAAALLAWGWTALPVRIDTVTARFGLEAQALLAGQSNWLAPAVTGAPRAAGLLTGLLALLLRSGPAASHMVGLLAGLATIAATWLLAVELLALELVDAAAPQRMGLWAAGFTGCALALLHFGRLAPFLPATAAGTAAVWLLLAGQRRQNVGFVAASGLLIAVACWLDRSGAVFALTLLVWQLGELGEARRPRPPAPLGASDRQGRLRSVWALWTLAALAPLLVAWLLDPHALAVYLHGGQEAGASDWWANLWATAATFFWLPDASAVFGPAGHFVNSLVAPLFVLGVGGLLYSLARPLGWRLLSWLAVGLLFSSMTNGLAPYWPALLPLLPLVGIVIVYALDRIAALWGDPAAEYAEAGALLSLTLGLLLAVAALTAVQYYQFAAVDGDRPSYTGRALATLPADAIAVLVASTPAGAVRLDDPVVQFAAGPRANQALAVLASALPARLPPGSRIIVQGGDLAALAAVQTHYPGATLKVVRDLRSNPRLYLLQV